MPRKHIPESGSELQYGKHIPRDRSDLRPFLVFGQKHKEIKRNEKRIYYVS